MYKLRTKRKNNYRLGNKVKYIYILKNKITIF